VHILETIYGTCATLYIYLVELRKDIPSKFLPSYTTFSATAVLSGDENVFQFLLLSGQKMKLVDNTSTIGGVRSHNEQRLSACADKNYNLIHSCLVHL
jgi:hypothetical protein